MTNDKNITRYEVNEYGEIPLSYGRYVRWEDYEDAMQELLGRIEKLEQKLEDTSDYWSGYGDGYYACERHYEYEEV